MLAALGLGGVLAAGTGAGAADPPAAGSYNAMVVFAKFRDEAPGTDTAPSWSPGLFDRSRPGSFAHFYEQMSGGRLRVAGANAAK